MEFITKKLLKLCYKDFKANREKFQKMYKYYQGVTDAKEDYKMITSRSNTKVGTNFFKKFVKEEVSYSIGNDINYIILGNDEDNNADEVLEDIRYYTAHIKADHDVDFFKDMLIYSFAYELYYFDDDGNFNMSVLTPDEAYLYRDEFGVPKYFFHIYKKRFSNDTIIKVYDDKEVVYYNEEWKVLDRYVHKFSSIPVGVARVSDELENDSLYNDIKGLQDAYETNLSDISNEISDFRNAYLVFKGTRPNDEQFKDMKKLGAMMMPYKDGSVEWLIKDINDDFIQNTLTTLEEKMYQISSHINYNEKMQSNASSLALKARLISLETKCRLNEKSFSNAIQQRIKFLFEYIEFVTDKPYLGDYRNVQVRFTPNIPSDELLTAQMIQALGDKISKQTALSLLPFVENPETELAKIKKEEEEEYGGSLPELKLGVEDEQTAD